MTIRETIMKTYQALITVLAGTLLCVGGSAGCSGGVNPQADGDPTAVGAQEPTTKLHAQGGGFSHSCSDVRLTNNCNDNTYCNLGATCGDGRGGYNSGAWINLDNWVTNNNGYWGWIRGGGGFAGSSNNIGAGVGGCSPDGPNVCPDLLPINSCEENYSPDFNYSCGGGSDYWMWGLATARDRTSCAGCIDLDDCISNQSGNLVFVC
jgi:hypothetical protein